MNEAGDGYVGAETASEAFKPLGKDYVDRFAKASAARWMDPFPRPGKRPGAYMNPGAFDVHPYLLLNLSDKYDGLTTYAHEWGHAMHSLLANSSQPKPGCSGIWSFPNTIGVVSRTAL